jgi:flagellar motor switch protein FliN/FliY
MNNNLINSIPVKLSIILGETEKSIEDLSKITVNSEIELRKPYDETVEILANGIPIGNGEIITIGDNFGVRVKEVYSPEKQKEKMSKGNKILFTTLKIIQ